MLWLLLGLVMCICKDARTEQRHMGQLPLHLPLPHNPEDILDIKDSTFED